MKRLLAIYHDPARLRKALSLGSGALIAMGLALIYGLNLAFPGNVLLVAATLLTGWDIARRAFSSLRNRYISIELLVTIAAAGALVIGEYWEAAAVTFLFIFGAYLEARTLSRTRQVLGELLDMAPATATVVRAGQQVQVSPAEVALDEIVWVKPGEKLAVDGVVVNGRSNVDEAAITGEPIPEAKTPGDPV
jgi:Cd2+/Zn2+-exporting ATPase